MGNTRNASRVPFPTAECEPLHTVRSPVFMYRGFYEAELDFVVAATRPAGRKNRLVTMSGIGITTPSPWSVFSRTSMREKYPLLFF